MKIVIFAGTSEGKSAAALLAQRGHTLDVTVATEYGRCIFEESLTQKNICLLEGRLNPSQMQELIDSARLVVDATHPYAVEASKNILSACEAKQKPYLRIVRSNEDSSLYEDVIVWARDSEDAIRILDSMPGNVLLTTGSKDLPRYTKVADYKERLFPRILPDIPSLEIAMNNGYKKKNIICMQGPFTHEVNASMLEMIGARLLLTKETGASGGYYEKLSACRSVGAKAVVIRRPEEEIEKKNETERRIRVQSATVEELSRFLDGHGSDFEIEELSRFLEKRSAETISEKLSGKQDDQSPYAEGSAMGISEQSSEQTEVTVPKISFQNPPRFPIFIDLKDKQVTVIGSGNIARRRIRALLDYGARVRVISPRAESNLQMAGILDWEAEKSPQYRGSLEVISRRYEAGDLAGSVLAVAATDDREVNHAAYREACELGIFISVADQSSESSYYFPALWAGEDLSIGLVGDGRDHGYVRRSADKLRSLLGEVNWNGLRRGNDEED